MTTSGASAARVVGLDAVELLAGAHGGGDRRVHLRRVQPRAVDARRGDGRQALDPGREVALVAAAHQPLPQPIAQTISVAEGSSETTRCGGAPGTPTA